MLLGASDFSITAIICTFNGLSRGYLSQAIESILQQTVPLSEIILVDDGSTDATAEWVKQKFPQIEVLSKRNEGLASARNFAWRHSKSKLICFLDDDDVWKSKKIETQLVFFSQQRDWGIWALFSEMEFIDSDGKSNSESFHKPLGRTFPEILLSNHIPPPSTLMLPKDLIEKAGGFSEGLNHSEDYDFYIRLSQLGKLEVLPTPLIQYRRHHHQMTQNRLKIDRCTLAVVTKHSVKLNSSDQIKIQIYIYFGTLVRSVHLRDKAAFFYWLRQFKVDFLLFPLHCVARIFSLVVLGVFNKNILLRKAEYQLFLPSRRADSHL